ncbi:MAG: hypothetical protein A3I44_02580 [Candidatus Sungbacteria bacterium RIFCSPLOWO2_02_FULL_51_17]|uniref:FAD/NAD(P)-binding domain-containing protein n=1 Tax=Candidatus Sungbacteria bacterium RIFCSPHIGHO2_02_FULL_51_29 TaxID=1802273 RepID=A0A1G2KVM6_9BACT|nr:MAG: hypothetical protein A2676_00220 [Candidatus Sungbacteria bacterium RIFCSPHIGHO2_01_FULL_51_22]OHA02469.1 MAG: hypothetical protein A3C16_05330 [Candidatus Sungbacteria bacterium RIFCSPHIGHO2_02_FULL_51_29]OHA06745.1 MAG: hypothetical protein A3B29_00935 [Candidatus Sungbacteria bacterium RIFCSPLOWO2_01_FULL_51_34]OHA11953.1 MAG: hypothetical protein A3I44_02580 [Candidatus Sungbacteria bacterium RIFCSPLOWO2_02_FULL_51_17]
MPEKQKNIIIAGAGFAGISVALHLAKHIRTIPGYTIILIDRNQSQLYTPALYETAAIPKEFVSDSSLKSSILIPVRDIVDGKPISFISDEIVGLTPSAKELRLRTTGILRYKYLVLALGSETNYFNIPGLQEWSFPLKTFMDGVGLRNAVEEVAKRKDHLRVVVGGAGASGVEMISEFIGFMCELQKEILPKKKICDAEFLLLEAAPTILPGFNPAVITRGEKRLKQLGIAIRTDTAIMAVEERSIVLKTGERIAYDILLWTGGVTGPALYKTLGLPVSPKGVLIVDEHLCVQKFCGSLFAAGDNASVTSPETGKPLPGNVPVAEQEGRLAATNILRTIRHQPPKCISAAKKYPFILAVGRRYAIADLVFFRFWGLPGWFAKQLVELSYLLRILPTRKALAVWWNILRYYSKDS